jgi:glutamine synthetase
VQRRVKFGIVAAMDTKQLRKKFEEHAITRVKIGGFDVDGVLRGKYVSLEKFWSSAGTSATSSMTTRA